MLPLVCILLLALVTLSSPLAGWAQADTRPTCPMHSTAETLDDVHKNPCCDGASTSAMVDKHSCKAGHCPLCHVIQCMTTTADTLVPATQAYRLPPYHATLTSATPDAFWRPPRLS